MSKGHQSSLQIVLFQMNCEISYQIQSIESKKSIFSLFLIIKPLPWFISLESLVQFVTETEFLSFYKFQFETNRNIYEPCDHK